MKNTDAIAMRNEIRLFSGISKEDLAVMLDCLNARSVRYPKGSFVFLAGDAASRVGIVCEGEVQVVREDVFGNRAILSKLERGDLFGETFACAGVERMPVSVLATQESEVLLIDYRRIVTSCPSSCAFHGKLIENMLGILAAKNLLLNRKIEALSARTTRGKLMAYLAEQAAAQGSSHFRIPFDRQELADYLAVDRSAMSAELGRMRDDGLIRFHRDDFELLRGE
jgi:cAMP-binding proteins - catabolite gene activator and regulatory subunit of cAMP-dependent protein kinases